MIPYGQSLNVCFSPSNTTIVKSLADTWDGIWDGYIWNMKTYKAKLSNVEEQGHLHCMIDKNIIIIETDIHIHNFPTIVKRPTHFNGGENNYSQHCISERKTAFNYKNI